MGRTQQQCYVRFVGLVDVVVVSYNSGSKLRGCVEPLARLADVHVVVVDNDSSDGSLETVADLPVRRIATGRNGGFAFGCNAGWRASSSPFVLFLNPDARMTEESLRRLVEALERDDSIAIAGPKLLEEDGSLALSQRRFPRLRSTYAHALFLHRLFPLAAWASELVRDPAAYEMAGSPDWVSGACLLARRNVLEQLGGWDEGFFLYCEDKDLCRRARDLGYDVLYVPDAVAEHEGGASMPRTSLLPVLASSRVRYARRHRGAAAAAAERFGIALTALTHVAVTRGGRAARAGHARAFRASAFGRVGTRPGA